MRHIVTMFALLSAVVITGCTPSANTPSLPAYSSVPTSRDAAAIQNTEALDQSLESGYTGPR